MTALTRPIAGAKTSPLTARLGDDTRQGASPVSQPAIPANPWVGWLGASRERQNNGTVINSNSQIQEFAMGHRNWARQLGLEFRTYNWIDPSGNQNSNNMNGLGFANDGDGIGNMLLRVPKILASDLCTGAQRGVLFIDTPSGLIQDGVTAASALAAMRTIIDPLFGYVHIIVNELWARNTLTGGPWTSGTASRLAIPAINAAIKAHCDTLGIEVMPFQTWMGDGTADNNPIAAYVRADGTHLSNVGGFFLGGKIKEFLAPTWPAYTLPDPTAAGDLYPNGQMVGTGGTPGTGAGGTIADNTTIARTTGSTASAVCSVVAEVAADPVRFPGTKRKQKLVINGCASLSGVTRDVITVNPTSWGATTFTINHWYEAIVRLEKTASPSGGDGGYTVVLVEPGGTSTVVCPANAGGGAGGGFTDTGTMAATQEAFSVEVKTMPIKATATGTPIVKVQFAAVAGTDTPTWKIFDVQTREITDPTLIMYDESNVTVPTFVTPTSQSWPEETAFSLQMEATRPCWFSISGGADAAQFSISRTGLLQMLAVPNFEAPTDADLNNIYLVDVTATPYNLSQSPIVWSGGATITDVNDGYSTNFTGTNGTDLAVADPNFTRVDGATTAIQIQSNAARNTLSIAVTGYTAPQQGNTQEQQVTWTILSTSAKMSVAALMIDGGNFLGVGDAGGTGFFTAYRIGGGTLTNIATISSTDLYKSKANGDVMTARIYGGNLYVYQNSVLVKTVSVTTQLAALSAARKSGLVSSTNASSNNSIDNWNNRESPAVYPEKIGLRLLSITPGSPAAASGAFATAISGRTANSSVYLGAVTLNTGGGPVANGDWIADGDFIRCATPQVGTYSIPTIEDIANSANGPRTTNLAVTFT